MQSEFAHLVRQQVILKGLGYYTGPIDGIWGPMSIDAKRRFEADKSFLPGLPNNGLPFAHSRPWPAGITRDPSSGMLYHPCIDKFKAEEASAIKAGKPKRPVEQPAAPKEAPAEDKGTMKLKPRPADQQAAVTSSDKAATAADAE